MGDGGFSAGLTVFHTRPGVGGCPTQASPGCERGRHHPACSAAHRPRMVGALDSTAYSHYYRRARRAVNRRDRGRQVWKNFRGCLASRAAQPCGACTNATVSTAPDRRSIARPAKQGHTEDRGGQAKIAAAIACVVAGDALASQRPAAASFSPMAPRPNHCTPGSLSLTFRQKFLKPAATPQQ